MKLRFDRYITSRMLQPYCPNSVIILLSFLWLPSVLQPSKQTFAYEVTATDLASSEVLRPTIIFKCLKVVCYTAVLVSSRNAPSTENGCLADYYLSGAKIIFDYVALV